MAPYLLSQWEYLGLVFDKLVTRTNGISRLRIKKDLEEFYMSPLRISCVSENVRPSGTGPFMGESFFFSLEIK